MKIKLVNTVVHAENFELVKNWYVKTFDLSVTEYPEEAGNYVDLSSEGQDIVGIAQNDNKNHPLPSPRSNGQYLQISCSHIFTIFERVKANGGSVTWGPERGNGYWCGEVLDIEGNQIWLFTPDSDLVEKVPDRYKS